MATVALIPAQRIKIARNAHPDLEREKAIRAVILRQGSCPPERLQLSVNN
jgi:hypothetical protein